MKCLAISAVSFGTSDNLAALHKQIRRKTFGDLASLRRTIRMSARQPLVTPLRDARTRRRQFCNPRLLAQSMEIALHEPREAVNKQDSHPTFAEAFVVEFLQS